MITVHGIQGTEEYDAAVSLKNIILTHLPTIESEHFQTIDIVSGVKCYGSRTKDIDILLFGNFKKPLEVNNGAETTPIYGFCVTIEVKTHNSDSVRFEGNTLSVIYNNEWHSATEQSFNQQISLRKYLLKNGIAKPPYIDNFIWLLNVPSKELPKSFSNILGSNSTWTDFLNKMSVYRDRTGQSRIGFFRQDYRPLVDIFTKELIVTRLDRRKMDTISKDNFREQQYIEKIGKQLLIFRGKGGTGKTVKLLQLAHFLYQEQGARVLILTYNKALVADIKRILNYMRIKDGLACKSIEIETIHKFMFELLKSLDLISGHDFLDDYEPLKKQALALMDAVNKEDIEQQKSAKSRPFSWHYIFIDEGQDWPEDECDILFATKPFTEYVVADGIDQMVRFHSGTDWSSKIYPNKPQIVSLRKALRLKSVLCDFVKSFAEEVGLGGWDVERNSEAHGGQVIIIEGAYSASKDIHDYIIKLNKDDKNENVDMLFCVPPELVKNDEEGRYSIVGKFFRDWGFKVWDGVNNEERDSYAADPSMLRIVQYESCRGLEGWVVVNFLFDKFYEHKIKNYEPNGIEKNDLYFNEHEAAKKHAAQWLMIPLTRAMDTLVIQISSRETIIGQTLLKIAQKYKDNIEWKTIEN